MNKQLECEIIRDLLPGYVEGLTSEASNREVEKHLKNCAECMEYYRQMNSDINIESEENTENIKNAFIKTKRMYILNGVFWTMCILSMIIPLIVDFCVNRYLSWSYIALGGCIAGYSLLRILIFNNNKIRNSIGFISLYTLPYLYLIQIVVNKYFIPQPVYWFKSIAAPITISWIFIIWIDYFAFIKLRKNIFYKFSFISMSIAAGSFFTDSVIFLNGYYMKEDNVIDYIIYLSIAIGCLIFAKMNDNKNKS